MASHGRETYRPIAESSSADDTDDIDGLSKPLGVIRISDRHYRESNLKNTNVFDIEMN